MPLVTLVLLRHRDRLPAKAIGQPLIHDAPTEALREASDALRYWLERLDRERVGQLAACYIDHATHLLDHEAMTLIVGKPDNPKSSGSDKTPGGDENNLG